MSGIRGIDGSTIQAQDFISTSIRANFLKFNGPLQPHRAQWMLELHYFRRVKRFLEWTGIGIVVDA